MNRTALALSVLSLALPLSFSSAGCKKKVTQAQCEELLDRYAMMVVKEKMKDAPPEQIKAEQAREHDSARSDDSFKNCTSELSIEDYDCAMKSTTPDALEKCLE